MTRRFFSSLFLCTIFSCLFSLLLHFALFFIFFAQLNSYRSKKEGQEKIMQCYVYRDSHSSHRKEHKESKRSKVAQRKAVKGKGTAKQSNVFSYSDFHFLLHNLIQSKIEYPRRVNLRQQEEVVVQFVLLPSGKIKDIKISNSSNNRALDQATIRAIREIAPVNLSEHDLKQEEEFRIKFVFSR